MVIALNACIKSPINEAKVLMVIFGEINIKVHRDFIFSIFLSVRKTLNLIVSIITPKNYIL